MHAHWGIVGALVAIGACGGSALPSDPAAACTLHLLVPTKQKPVEGVSLTIDEPDQDIAPTAWQGPLHVSNGSGATCDHAATLGIISAPFLTNGGGKLFYREYSGSNQWVVLLDTKSCRVAWTSKPFGAGSISSPASGSLLVGRRTIALNADCLPR